MKLALLLLSFFSLTPFNSCTSAKQMADNQTSRGHFRLYSYPDKKVVSKLDDSIKRIVIVSSNNFEGSVWPEHFNIPNKFKEERVISIGGVSAMKAYSDIYKKVYKNQVLFVDSGSFYHPEKDYIKTAFLYNYLSPDVLALGTQEFSFSPRRRRYINKLESVTRKINTEIITSNLFDLTTAEKAKLRNIDNTLIKEINGLKVGFVSTLSQDLGKKIPGKNLLGLYVQNPSSTIISASESMRKAGAEIVVLLTNSTVDCSSKISKDENLPLEKVNFDPHDTSVCNMSDSELANILSQLPPRTLDLAITSDGEGKVANFIHGIPVMQNFGKGKYFSWAELFYDDKHKVLLRKKTKLHQPVMLCHQFLKENQDCYLEESLNNKEVVPAKFLGVEVNPQTLPTK